MAISSVPVRQAAAASPTSTGTCESPARESACTQPPPPVTDSPTRTVLSPRITAGGSACHLVPLGQITGAREPPLSRYRQSPSRTTVPDTTASMPPPVSVHCEVSTGPSMPPLAHPVSRPAPANSATQHRPPTAPSCSARAPTTEKTPNRDPTSPDGRSVRRRPGRASARRQHETGSNDGNCSPAHASASGEVGQVPVAVARVARQRSQPMSGCARAPRRRCEPSWSC